jgi:hypothetical protein
MLIVAFEKESRTPRRARTAFIVPGIKMRVSENRTTKVGDDRVAKGGIIHFGTRKCKNNDLTQTADSSQT